MKDLVLSGEDQFAIMSIPDIRMEIEQNLGADGISAFDLPKITVPTGGGKHWTIPDIEAKGGERAESEITGIIIMTQTARQLWERPYEEGHGDPPLCYSSNGIEGHGEPGGECMSCPYNEFETHEDRRKKACREQKLIFIVLKDDVLPTMIVAPPTSLKNVKKYLVGLTSKRRPVFSVYTTLSLERDKNEDNIEYSKIVLQKVGDVENPEITKAYAMSIRPFLENTARTAAKEPAQTKPESTEPESEPA